MNFDNLIQNITTTDKVLQTEAVKAINKALTARNWLIGLYIVEFEQNGEDRAKYGTRLVDVLAEKLNKKGLSGRSLKLFRQFYLAYPQLGNAISEYLKATNFSIPQIVQTSSAQLQRVDNQQVRLSESKIFNNLSFSHLTLLLSIKDPLKRTFYEMECMKNVWIQKELDAKFTPFTLNAWGCQKNPKSWLN